MTASGRIRDTPRRLAARVRRGYGGTPLRVKLVGVLLVLVTAALVGSGWAGAATLHAYLVGRVDSQLRAAERPILEQARDGNLNGDGAADHSGGHDGKGDDGHSHLPSDFVVSVLNGKGTVVEATNQLIDPGEALPKLPHPTGAETKAAGTHTLTVNAVRDDDQWRVLAVPYQLSDGSSGSLLIAQSLGPVESTVRHVELLALVIGSICVVVVAGVGYLVVRASLRPLRAVERTAADIAAGDLSHRVPDADPRTEVGQLSRALNTMLGEIETAFAARAASEQAARASEDRMRDSEAAARESEHRMRRFVADASHELRTPLTSIRGFAELYRQGAARDDAEITRMMRRIEDEAKRMGLLVEDLLLLARLDQERPLAQAPVDLLALVTDAVHDARAVAPDRPISLTVGRTDAPPVVTGDEGRLRQVLGNLVTNALKHTPDATPVSVRLGTATGDGPPLVVLEVADEGPGMSAEVAEHVFERFYRADQARRSDGSTGLGLAIVAALVAGHAGRISVTTGPGHGTTFRVELPIAETSPVN
jgi:two-component system OmpR family sensor kinase